MSDRKQSPLAALTEQVGGEKQLKWLMITFSKGALQDLDLQVAFKGMDAELLAYRMTNLIKMVFGYACKSNMVNSNIRGQAVLRNYALFEVGLSRFQLRKLQIHFEATMRDFNVTGEVFQRCKDRFADLCILFDTENQGLQEDPADAIFKNDPAMIMIARSRRSMAPKAA